MPKNVTSDMQAWIRFGVGAVTFSSIVWGLGSRFTVVEKQVEANTGNIEKVVHAVEVGFRADEDKISAFANRSRDQYFEVKNQVEKVQVMQSVIADNQKEIEIRQAENHSEIVSLISAIAESKSL